MANSVSQDRQIRKEVPISVKEWGGLLSNVTTQVIPANAFSNLLNMEFDGPYKISSRKGSVEYFDETATGAVEIIEAFEFKKSTEPASKIVFATSDGKLYYVPKGMGNTPVLIGSLANPTPSFVGMAQMANALYIADGISAFKWDGVTLTDIKSTFPSIAPLTTGNIIDVAATRGQLWWFDSNDYAYASAFNIPDDLTTTSAGAFKAQIQYGDGAQITNAVAWLNTIIISKVDTERGHHIMYWVRGLGTTSDPYRIDQLFGDPKNPTAFVGRSAVQVGSDVMGLTLGGVTTISAINNFQEVKPNSASLAIDDIIQRINFAAPEKICGIFDTVKRQYMLAVPLDGSTVVNKILVYDVDGDRWTTFDNWDVRCWLRVNQDILFGTRDGRMMKIKSGEADDGAGYTKKLVSGDNDYGAVDIVKLFKSAEIKFRFSGNYNINYSFYVDNTLVNESPIKLALQATSASLWGVFRWGIDRWGGRGNSIKHILLMARGKTIRHEISNSNPGEPFTIEAMTTRLVVKDSGESNTN